MPHPQAILIQDFTYELPDARIARRPLPQRDASKLLVYRDGQIGEDVYRNIARHLDPGALLVFNNTRVIPARLQFVKPSGGVIEIFCLAPEGEWASQLIRSGSAVWTCLVGGAKKWKNEPLVWNFPPLRLQAELLDRGGETSRVQFSWDPPALSFAEVLELAGQVPLPPYLQRPAEAADRERYQTIYARYDGSVAAPTAGLHFTDQVFAQLAERNIRSAYVTLHVGAGTFKPVKTAAIGDHEMHAEYFEVPGETVRQLCDQLGKGQLVAVGTTSLRTLESLFLLGSMLQRVPDCPPQALEIGQWEAFDPAHETVSVSQALDNLLVWMDRHGLPGLVAKTRLLIAPGYRLRVADALITNFHQPASTLLLLVAAMVGPDWRRIYDYALGHDFRFLSYGDGSLLFRGPADRF